MIRLEILIDDMTSSALLHVIDSKTSYNMLLGRPWLHENGIVPSTLHQCFKYCRNGVVKKVAADNKPFTEAESHFADAKFYLASIVVKEVPPTVSSSSCKLQIDFKSQEDGDIILDKLKKGECQNEERRSEDKHKEKGAPVLRYVPKVKKEEDLALKGLTLPVTSINEMKVVPPLKESVCQTQNPKIEYDNLPTRRTDAGFDPNAYKLLAKAGYNPQDPNALGKLPVEVTGEKAYGLNSTQKMLRRKGYAVKNSQAGLGFTPPTPVRIVIKKSSNHYIAIDEESSPVPTKTSVLIVWVT